MPEIGKVSKVSVIGYNIEWKIKDFSSYSEKDGECYYSPSFSHDGESWYLGIDPNGDSYNDSLGHINLYLYRKSPGPPVNLKFSLSLKTMKGGKDQERYCSGIFQQWKHHQYLRFISRSELERRKYELLPSGVLTVVCTLSTQKSTESASETVIAECSYCKEIFDVEVISSHEKKCLEKPIKCPECSDVVLLQNWYSHECQTSKTQGINRKWKSTILSKKNKILQDFKDLFCSKEDCDVVIRVKGQEFPAHKAILKARSPVFASTFRNEMKEKATGIMDIEDCDPSIFSDFLCFLYCEDIENLSRENVFSLFTAADKYDIPDLREMCMEFIKTNLSVDSFCETITLALQHSEADLTKLATDFFIQNAQNIIMTAKWQSFIIENPVHGNELFIKFMGSNRCSKT